MQRDSLDKIFGRYILGVARESFTFNGERYSPKSLQLSPKLLRSTTCILYCAGCCPVFSLDWLREEMKPDDVAPRQVEVNGTKYAVYSDFQGSNNGHFCRYVNPENGACEIHEKNPLSCDLEMIKCIRYNDPTRHDLLITKKFGRGWSYRTITGDRGALCEVGPVTEASIYDTIRKIERLKTWCEWFEIDHVCDQIISVIKSRKLLKEPIVISKEDKLWGPKGEKTLFRP